MKACYYVLCYVEMKSFDTWLMNFCHDWMLNLSNAFCAFIERLMWFLHFIILKQCITLIDQPVLASQEWTLLDHSVWSFLCAAEFYLLVFCWEFKNLHLSRVMTVILFSCNLPISLSYQSNIGFVKWVWKCYFFFNFLEDFENDWH